MISSLIQGMRASDDYAVNQFFRQYGPLIRSEARFATVDSRIGRIADEDDICQSVAMRIWVKLADGQYAIQSEKDLIGLLKVVVRAYVADLARHCFAERRDLRRDVVFERQEVPATKQVDPAAEVSRQELLSELRARLPNRQWDILELRLEGAEWEHIAEQTGDLSAEATRKKHQRSVQRVAQELAAGR